MDPTARFRGLDAARGRSRMRTSTAMFLLLILRILRPPISQTPQTNLSPRSALRTVIATEFTPLGVGVAWLIQKVS